jgi:hypothetical protein
MVWIAGLLVLSLLGVLFGVALARAAGRAPRWPGDDE